MTCGGVKKFNGPCIKCGATVPCACFNVNERKETLLPENNNTLCKICHYDYSVLKNGNKTCMCTVDKVSHSSLSENKKDTNPKDAVGTKKVPFSVLPWKVIAEVALALLEGARKYGRHNWRVAGVRASVYIDASMRHLTDFWEGTDTDPDSGLSHVTKAIASLVVLRDSMLLGNWKDDRPPKIQEGWIQELNKKAADIIEKYPNALEPYTQVSVTERKTP